jgi:hypothetical protein
LLAEKGAVHRVVLLQLHGLHLLLDGIHGGGVVWSSLTSATSKSEGSLKTHVTPFVRVQGHMTFKKLRGFSPRENYTDGATVACRRS